MTQPIHPMRAKMEEAIRRELGKREMVLTSPQQLEALRAARIARAAIQALLEPDEGMKRAGADGLFGSVEDDWAADARRIFRAMLLPLKGEGE